MSRRVVLSSVEQPYGLCEFGFQGKRHDESIDLIQHGRRYTHPRFGRFLTRDPTTYSDGMNFYASYFVMRGGLDPRGLDTLTIHDPTNPFHGGTTGNVTLLDQEIPWTIVDGQYHRKQKICCEEDWCDYVKAAREAGHNLSEQDIQKIKSALRGGRCIVVPQLEYDYNFDSLIQSALAGNGMPHWLKNMVRNDVRALAAAGVIDESQIDLAMDYMEGRISEGEVVQAGLKDAVLAVLTAKMGKRIFKLFGGKCKTDVKCKPRLSPQDQKSIRSLQKRIDEHRKKLQDYIQNPDAYDNLGRLRDAPTPEIRQMLIEGRIRKLRKEMDNYQRQINNIRCR